MALALCPLCISPGPCLLAVRRVAAHDTSGGEHAGVPDGFDVLGPTFQVRPQIRARAHSGSRSFNRPDLVTRPGPGTSRPSQPVAVPSRDVAAEAIASVRHVLSDSGGKGERTRTRRSECCRYNGARRMSRVDKLLCVRVNQIPQQLWALPIRRSVAAALGLECCVIGYFVQSVPQPALMAFILVIRPAEDLTDVADPTRPVCWTSQPRPGAGRDPGGQ